PRAAGTRYRGPKYRFQRLRISGKDRSFGEPDFGRTVCVGRVSPPAAIEYKDGRAANKPTRAEGMASVSNDDSHVRPRTLASATVLQIVPALREEPLPRAPLDVACRLAQSAPPAV